MGLSKGKAVLKKLHGAFGFFILMHFYALKNPTYISVNI